MREYLSVIYYQTILTKLVVSVCGTLLIRRPTLRSWAASKLSSSVYQGHKQYQASAFHGTRVVNLQGT